VKEMSKMILTEKVK